MTYQSPSVRSAALHAAGTCALVALVALWWVASPVDRSASWALATTAVIGLLAWVIADRMFGTRSALAAENDNHPFDPLYLVWAPIDRDG